ncbi:MAG: metal ABC transporter substrate-binding protein [Spirochaetales bacterium]|nr:metal ABC transporter substrate-binding protein [Spirochaetales bacterium]
MRNLYKPRRSQPEAVFPGKCTRPAKRAAFFSVVFALALGVFSGCGKEGSASAAAFGSARSGEKLKVTAANFPAFDLARAVAGERIELLMLLPPGAESHSFEPSPKDIVSIRNSDVFIYTGGESDAWAEKILETSASGAKRVITLMSLVDAVEEEIVPGMEEEAGEEEGPAYDEHVWTSPRNAKVIALFLAQTFSELDPPGAGEYAQRAAAYAKELDELDAEFTSAVKAGRRKTFVFGDRFPFRYFADAYGLAYFAAFPGCSTETECSAATLAFLIDKVKAEKIPVVFHIELSNEKIADALCEATGAKKLLLHACHNISRDDFQKGLGYLDFMRMNLANVKEALR